METLVSILLFSSKKNRFSEQTFTFTSLSDFRNKHLHSQVMSKIQKQNEKYLARIEQSLAAERNHQLERKQRADNRNRSGPSEKSEDREKEKCEREQKRLDMEERKERSRGVNEAIASRNDSYATWWIETLGKRVNFVMSIAKEETPREHLKERAEKLLRIRMYNRSQRKVVEHTLFELIRRGVGDRDPFPERRRDSRHQVEWFAERGRDSRSDVEWDRLLLSSALYDHLRLEWQNHTPRVERGKH